MKEACRVFRALSTLLIMQTDLRNQENIKNLKVWFLIMSAQSFLIYVFLSGGHIR